MENETKKSKRFLDQGCVELNMNKTSIFWNDKIGKFRSFLKQVIYVTIFRNLTKWVGEAGRSMWKLPGTSPLVTTAGTFWLVEAISTCSIWLTSRIASPLWNPEIKRNFHQHEWKVKEVQYNTYVDLCQSLFGRLWSILSYISYCSLTSFIRLK